MSHWDHLCHQPDRVSLKQGSGHFQESPYPTGRGEEERGTQVPVQRVLSTLPITFFAPDSTSGWGIKAQSPGGRWTMGRD